MKDFLDIFIICIVTITIFFCMMIFSKEVLIQQQAIHLRNRIIEIIEIENGYTDNAKQEINNLIQNSKNTIIINVNKNGTLEYGEKLTFEIITFYERYTLGETGNASEDILYHKLRKDLSTAFKKDFENDKNREENCKPVFEYTSYGISSDTLSDKLILTFKCDSENTFSINSDDTYYVPKTYTETIKVLKDYHILNDDFTVNHYY